MNFELRLKIHFKVFSYHNKTEVELFQEIIYRIFCKSIISIGSISHWVNQSLHLLQRHIQDSVKRLRWRFFGVIKAISYFWKKFHIRCLPVF